MRILVTGGAGFIGSNMVDALLARGDSVLVVDDLSTGKRSNIPAAVDLVKMDIGSPDLMRVVQGFQPEAITHCAAQSSVAVSMSNPSLDAGSNILGGINLMEAAVASGCGQIVYITTGGALYGPPDYLPCDEGHPIRPASAYGLSKWTLECYFKMMLPPLMPLKVLRLANVYGPRQDPHGEAGVVAIFAAQMVRGEPVTIFGDGGQTRDFVFVGDVVRAHDMALVAEKSLTVNVCSAAPVSVNELYTMLAEETGYSSPPVYREERPGDIRHSVLANAKAKEELGWGPETGFRDGLRATVEWVRSLR